ncbi:2-dehydro-3-deoxy-6-phosphogalactonate aldolase [Paracoccus caeni]|uniref:2-dehydro-3-deoxy-6-phosphogalactonate aldolase n=1 Tax=Paracoccus caeni TaxID=657651 RepID=A0A934SF48_9RHOB|nr:2-dehydro-3-deoxy-6-phosphogalactonate aldolase [Paracoccus caeni]MBK4216732.1 2-dehydro-3-deoxy-6-phosphogalactonate aldolase [Paracoccus caeni]
MDFEAAFAACPLVAILRGLRPDEALDHGKALTDAGFTLLEVPLNSPEPLDSIATLSANLPQALVGAGTVLTAEDVRLVAEAGGRLIVAPNFSPAVAAEARRLNLIYLPGIGTMSEAFAALDAGASALKLFPAEMIPPVAVKAMRSVLPKDARLLPVGGINAQTMAAYLQAGANGFGLGGSLYSAGQDFKDTADKAAILIEAYKNFRSAGAG